MPRLSLTVLYVNPVARCATVMDAPATTPAEASVTLPDKEADATCARAAPATQRKTMSAFMTCCPGRKLTIYPRKKRYRVFQPGIVQPIGGKTAELANRLFPNPVPIFAVAGGILKQLPGNFRGVGRFERGPGAGPALQRHQGAHGAPVSGPNFRKLGQGHFERQLPVRPDPLGETLQFRKPARRVRAKSRAVGTPDGGAVTVGQQRGGIVRHERPSRAGARE